MSELIDYGSRPKEDIEERRDIPDKSSFETANSFPELIVNQPLENTSLIYSVPVMGEWKNGKLPRMLRGMLSQRPDKGESCELELLINTGTKLNALMIPDMKEGGFQKDKHGKILLNTEAKDEQQKEALELLQESKESLAYLRTLVEVQSLARDLKARPGNFDIQTQMDTVMSSIEDPSLREVAQLAAEKCGAVSLAVVDASRTIINDTEYNSISISSLRTLGADIAAVRFQDNPEVVLGMWDADTVPESNHAAKEVQQIFSQHPSLNYLFAGMTNFPAGHSPEYFSDAPRENIRRTWAYNSTLQGYGAPQIMFRLRAYNKLKELSGLHGTGFYGDEDRDTSMRLIYHFGSLQDGLLLESSANLYPPTSITADRLDGSVDSYARGLDFAENGARFMENDLGKVFDLKDKLNGMIEQMPLEKQLQIMQVLEQARTHYIKRQNIQKKFNRTVLRSFLHALDKNFIKLKENKKEAEIDEHRLSGLTGGKALLDYIKTNNGLVDRILTTPDDIEVIKYYLGLSETPPPALTPFQFALREYIGDIRSFNELIDSNVIASEKVQNDNQEEWKVVDSRDEKSGISLMHSSVAETLALAHTYKMFFETDAFLRSRDDSDSEYPQFSRQWPKNPDDQTLYYRFGNQEERLRKVKENMGIGETDSIAATEPQPQPKGFLSQLRFRSIALFELLKQLKG